MDLLNIIFQETSTPMIVVDVTDVNHKNETLHGVENINKNSNYFKVNNDYLSCLKIIYMNKSAVNICYSNNITDKNAYKSKIITSIFKYIYELVILKNNKNKFAYEIINIENNNKSTYKILFDFINHKKNRFCLISIIDITSYKNCEFILKEFVEKYQILLDSFSDAMFFVDIKSSNIIEYNKNAIKFFDYKNSNIIGSKHYQFFKNKNRDIYLDYYFKKIHKQAQDGDTVSVNVEKNNNEIPVRVEVNVKTIGGDDVAHVIICDMSSKFKLEETKRLLATAVDQADESIMITDIYGNIQYINPSFENISGYSYTDVVGKNSRILQSGETPKYLYKLMWTDITQGKVWRGTFTNQRKNGEIYKEETTITPVIDNNGKIVNYVAVKRDVTRQLSLEQQIRHSQKMHAIGALAGGVAHDFNNILTAIMGFAELSQFHCEYNSIVHTNLTEIIKGVDRAGKLVNQILQFSQKTESNISSIKINEIVQEACRLLRASFPANIELIIDDAQEYYVKADPTQIHQIILNLCTNSYHAMEGKKGWVRLRLERRFLSPKEGVDVGNLPHGFYICLHVADNGLGIPPEYLSRVFEPYFTTKISQEGTGLGLSVVHGIVNDHRGAVTVVSQPGQETCFTVYLPEAKADATIITKKKQKKSTVSCGKILVVDDEQSIILFLVNSLLQVGFEVDSCESSSEALQLFSQKQKNYNLVITDMGMPGLNGLELAEQLKMIEPGIPIILCTGFSEHVTKDNFEEKGLAGFVTKPFTAEQLTREVIRILGNCK